MSTTAPIINRIQSLKKQYEALQKGKESLLALLDETEVAENVYNSNAIENSTLTLKETEKILLQMEISRHVSIREVLEAKNLAVVSEYIRKKAQSEELNRGLILLLHKMLIGSINDTIAGRFRERGEYVRVGTHIAPPPEHVELMMEQLLQDFASDITSFFADTIAKFHLDFETIHPFNDGNGRIGRVIMNYQFLRYGFPPIIIRNKEKQIYYQDLRDYNENKNTRGMEKVVTLALTESLHKRVTYLKGEHIITLADYSKKNNKSASAVLNAARRQNIPAFREKGIWKIGEE